MEELSNAGVVYPPYTRNYSYLAGTSMASPVVAGAAGTYMGFKKYATGYWNNLLTYQAIEKSADGVMGAAYGGWEYYQGYGSLNMNSLMRNQTTRSALGGGIEGILYADGTPIPNGRISAKRRGGTFTYVTTSGPHGTYRFDIMPPGIYDVTAVAFGKKKNRACEVIAGCDQPGVDFWTGTYSGDETPPIVPQLQVVSSRTTSVTIKHWAYDPESSIDRVIYRIGTTLGGKETKADSEVPQRNNSATLSCPLVSGQTYFIRGTYINGGGMVTNKDTSFTVP
jgi:hypothetical protein